MRPSFGLLFVPGPDSRLYVARADRLRGRAWPQRCRDAAPSLWSAAGAEAPCSRRARNSVERSSADTSPELE